MSNTPITKRQQYWLDHVRAAEDSDGSIADHARSEGLKPKELYFWKGILGRRGLLSHEATVDKTSGFVRVIAPSRPLGMCLVLQNGIRLDWHGDMGPDQLEALVLTASRLP